MCVSVCVSVCVLLQTGVYIFNCSSWHKSVLLFVYVVVLMPHKFFCLSFCMQVGFVLLSCWCFIVNCIECFYVNDEPESKFLYTETIKLYCIVLYTQSYKIYGSCCWRLLHAKGPNFFLIPYIYVLELCSQLGICSSQSRWISLKSFHWGTIVMYMSHGKGATVYVHTQYLLNNQSKKKYDQ